MPPLPEEAPGQQEGRRATEIPQRCAGGADLRGSQHRFGCRERAVLDVGRAHVQERSDHASRVPLGVRETTALLEGLTGTGPASPGQQQAAQRELCPGFVCHPQAAVQVADRSTEQALGGRVPPAFDQAACPSQHGGGLRAGTVCGRERVARLRCGFAHSACPGAGCGKPIGLLRGAYAEQPPHEYGKRSGPAA
jgi:hypothetical protein